MAQSRAAIPEQIARCGVIAIGRRLPPDEAVRIGGALARGGVAAFEITLGSDGALEAMRRLAKEFDEGTLLVGAGTVMNEGAAREAIDAGATFLVMPHVDVDLVRWAREREIPAFPGAFTPTEILAAWRAGAPAVKLFPASVAGPAFVRELRGPLPEIPLIPTGGVTIDSVEPFVAAGAAAVGLGSWLMAGRDASLIESRARSAVEAVRRARSTPGWELRRETTPVADG